MKMAGAEALILATSHSVWDVLTDAGNYPVWGSGITHIEGQIRDRASIRVKTINQGQLFRRLRVRVRADDSMSWTWRTPTGLLTVVRAFTVSSHAGFTHITVQDTVHGPLARAVARNLNGIYPVSSFVDEVKFRSELLSFHVQGGLFPYTDPGS